MQEQPQPPCCAYKYSYPHKIHLKKTSLKCNCSTTRLCAQGVSFLISPTTMLTILSILLVVLPLCSSNIICQNPPPSSFYIPTLSDCQDLVNDIFAISIMQHDEPIHWSNHPSAVYRNRILPYSFLDPSYINDCEFVVAALEDSAQDIFPTKVVAEAARGVVESCLERGIGGAQTLGSHTVGPKGVIAVVMLKRVIATGGVSAPLNLTDIQLSKPGRLSRPLSSLAEDG